MTRFEISSSLIFHSMSPATFSRKWARKCATYFNTSLSFIVFLWLDFVEILLCILFRYLDKFFEGKASACNCVSYRNGDVYINEENEVSETLNGRKNLFRQMGFLGFTRKWNDPEKINGEGDPMRTKWSDCGCESCVSWMNCDRDKQKLHVHVRETSKVDCEASRGKPRENVIFLHGFLSSSSFWTETIFPNLCDHQQNDYRLFAVDLLGFGRSLKPRDCFYTMKDHLEMIEKSVIYPFELKSFHLVAHSMGCIIALALAAKHSNLVRSITLVAPPCFPSNSKDEASFQVLNRVAEKRLWPLLSFGVAVMSWYEHLGRCICFLICRNHRKWGNVLKFVTGKRSLSFLILDFPKHTHQSAWLTMHNVICGAARHIDGYLETLTKSGVKLLVIRGDGDKTIPMECIQYIQRKAPDIAEISIIANANHSNVILRRRKEFAQRLEKLWAYSNTYIG